MARNLYEGALKSITQVKVHCPRPSCPWRGIVANTIPDVDGEGSLGCPICRAVVQEDEVERV